jgi:hypothetical protein
VQKEWESKSTLPSSDILLESLSLSQGMMDIFFSQHFPNKVLTKIHEPVQSGYKLLLKEANEIVVINFLKKSDSQLIQHSWMPLGSRAK